MAPNFLRLISIICLCTCTSTASAAAVYHAKVYSLEDTALSKPIFRVERVETNKGTNKVVVVKYLNLDGTVNCEEKMFYENGNLKKYIYNQTQVGDSGNAEIREGKIFYTFKSGDKEKTDDEDLEPNTLVSDMIGTHLEKHWEELEKGETLKIRYLLVERLETIGFKFFKEEDIDFEGKKAVRIRMKPSSFFIAAIAPSIELIVAKDAPHRLLQSKGRLPIRVPEVENPQSRKDWRAIDAILNLTRK